MFNYRKDHHRTHSTLINTNTKICYYSMQSIDIDGFKVIAVDNFVYNQIMLFNIIIIIIIAHVFNLEGK